MGITLQPGESIEVPLDALDLDEAVVELVRRGVVKLDIRQTDARETAPNHFQIDIEVLLDGKVYRKAVLSWDTVPDSWWTRLKGMFRRKG